MLLVSERSSGPSDGRDKVPTNTGDQGRQLGAYRETASAKGLQLAGQGSGCGSGEPPKI